MTTAPQTINDEQILLELARRKFSALFPYIWIQDTEIGTGAAFKFETWPHLYDVADLLTKQRLIVIMKSRQVGISWLLAAYSLWVALFNPGANVLLLSRGRIEAEELLGKVKFIFSHLPEELKQPTGSDSKTNLQFPGINSEIKALPATPNAGIGNTATLVLQDEADMHEYLEENFGMIRPTVDAPNSKAQHIMVSSPNPDTIDSFFKREVRRANSVDEHNQSMKDGQSTYALKYLSVWVRPGRDDAWYSETQAGYEDQHRFTSQYSRSLDEALSPPQTHLAFHKLSLDSMRTELRDPLDIEGAPLYSRIWQKYGVGKKYSAFTDTSHGVGQDFSVTVVVDAATGLVVADIMDNMLEPDDLAAWSVKLLDLYDRPIWGIEDNDWGVQTIKKAQQLGYRRLYHRPLSAASPHVKGAVGWHTSEQSRKSLFADLQQSVKDRAVTILAADGLKQFYETIKNPEKNGRIEAIQGGHDDYPLAVGGALQMVPHARRSRGTPATSEHFAREPMLTGTRPSTAPRFNWSIPT